MKRLLNLIIIVLVISLPFIPIADILIPKGVHLENQILSIILLIPIIKSIVCLVLIISHKAYNSNKQGWILFTIGLFAILPLYLEISILKSTQHGYHGLNRASDFGLIVPAITVQMMPL